MQFKPEWVDAVSGPIFRATGCSTEVLGRATFAILNGLVPLVKDEARREYTVALATAEKERDTWRFACETWSADMRSAAVLAGIRDDEYPLKAVQRLSTFANKVEQLLRNLAESVDLKNTATPTVDLDQVAHVATQIKACLALRNGDTK